VKKPAAAFLPFLVLFSLLISVPELDVAVAEPKTIILSENSFDIQRAINAASEGGTVFIKKGTYEEETLEINKRISLIGEDVENTIISLHPRWIESTQPFTPSYYEKAMVIKADNVKLSGFTINSVGGSLSVEGKTDQITGNIIATHLSLTGSYIEVSNNTITQGIGCYGSRNMISGNKIIESGIVVGGTEDGDDRLSTIYGNTITGCNNGIRLDGGGNTVFNNTIKSCYHAVTILGISSSNNVYANTVTGNIGGLDLFGQGNDNVFHGNYVASNEYGVLLSYTYMMSPGENNIVYQNNFVDNVEQISTSPTYPGTTAPTFPTEKYDNGSEGNYWNDYMGTDSDGDGIGDTPYIVDENRTDNYPLMEPVPLIPEFPSWIILPLLITATLVIMVCKQKLTKNRQPSQSY
jgi:nitrous oxidase accessory protein